MSFFSAWYKRRYHPTYVHAKKLFVFDLGLIAATIILFFAALFWFFYDPTVVRNVRLTMKGTSERVQSGDTVSFLISYYNASDVPLTHAALAVNLPPGFIPEGLPSRTIPIGEIPKDGRGEMSVRGRFYGAPNEPAQFSAELSYAQSGRRERELRRTALLFTAQAPTLAAELTLGPDALIGGTTPLMLVITNTNNNPTPAIEVPIELSFQGIVLMEPSVDNGTIQDGIWRIDPLAKNGAATLRATLAFTAPPRAADRRVPVVFAPSLVISSEKIPQSKATKTLTLIDPNIAFTAQLLAEKIIPGDTVPLELVIQNTGRGAAAETLERLSLSLPIPEAIVDATRLLNINNGESRNGVFQLDWRAAPQLLELAPGETRTLRVLLPIHLAPQGGTDLTLTLTPRVQATFLGRAPTTVFEASAQTSPIPIGTVLLAHDALRYYTEHGDQLGRGPLPFEHGVETKLGAVFTLQNTTSRIADVTLTGTLTPEAVWTGKTSVSHGRPITYAPDTRTVSWNISALEAHDTATLFMEIGFTPKASGAELPVILLTNLTLRGTDTFTGEPVNASLPPLDTSLSADSIAQTQIKNHAP